ncbi:ubiquitin carboxyl-terminal hydrolase MINDY-3 homolog [Leguminivora glycinivorella]|uniref:ubiquitin carboxyl-terminal hydrolase MINDY-3 homolog n=1 Tax=Leguminivora glycinivorella TaxID=1035111 RepID=UPI00200E162E|nr:ubiquitin carboxyl-terminal hydrolase MINDY-3 homolog [Leguminivora glycinivorella]
MQMLIGSAEEKASGSVRALEEKVEMSDSAGAGAGSEPRGGSAGMERELENTRRLLWGEQVKEEVFRRWAQGFTFSADEPSALTQQEGGPCAAIAPVQGFLLKILLSETPGHSLRDLTSEKCNSLLVRAVCTILSQCLAPKYNVAVYQRKTETEAESSSTSATEETETLEQFHRRIEIHSFQGLSEVEAFYTRNIRVLKDKYGVLLLLYSVILSKGVGVVEAELSELSDPLIHSTYGYGSQGLINLMLTGRAVAHVWDHDQVVGGLRLRGIERQNDIGFLTIMEHMQYCTVGSFYKNPKHPVWVLASETHLTVLFSFERRLAAPETAGESAERIFRSFDPEGNNFIPSAALQDVLCAAELVSEPEYVELMRRKLDAENLGIILLSAFMEEFFPTCERGCPDTFTLHHYNGLARSNPGGRVVYRAGRAALLECHMRAASADPMLTCLQTKWPSIDLVWDEGSSPSLN